MSTPSSSPRSRCARTRATIGLIGLAHGTSHFFHMLLPPLFPLFIRDFGFSYSELGLLVSTFFVISGIGQALAGFLVDRVGARPVLFAALACFALAALAAATASGYAGPDARRGAGRPGQLAVPSGRLHDPQQARLARRAWATRSRCMASPATWAGRRRRCS